MNFEERIYSFSEVLPIANITLSSIQWLQYAIFSTQQELFVAIDTTWNTSSVVLLDRIEKELLLPPVSTLHDSLVTIVQKVNDILLFCIPQCSYTDRNDLLLHTIPVPWRDALIALLCTQDQYQSQILPLQSSQSVFMVVNNCIWAQSSCMN